MKLFWFLTFFFYFFITEFIQYVPCMLLIREEHQKCSARYNEELSKISKKYNTSDGTGEVCWWAISFMTILFILHFSWALFFSFSALFSAINEYLSCTIYNGKYFRGFIFAKKKKNIRKSFALKTHSILLSLLIVKHQCGKEAATFIKDFLNKITSSMFRVSEKENYFELSIELKHSWFYHFQHCNAHRKAPGKCGQEYYIFNSNSASQTSSFSAFILIFIFVLRALFTEWTFCFFFTSKKNPTEIVIQSMIDRKVNKWNENKQTKYEGWSVRDTKRQPAISLSHIYALTLYSRTYHSFFFS